LEPQSPWILLVHCYTAGTGPLLYRLHSEAATASGRLWGWAPGCRFPAGCPNPGAQPSGRARFPRSAVRLGARRRKFVRR
jgi:hypothetical protein